MKMQGTQISQNNLENEEQTWKTNTTRLQTLLQSYSDHDIVLLAYGQT